MMQFVIIGLVIAVVYFIYFKKKPQKTQGKSTKKKEKNSQAEDMIECASCGVYSELGESILSNGKYYCSNECLHKES